MAARAVLPLCGPKPSRIPGPANLGTGRTLPYRGAFEGAASRWPGLFRPDQFAVDPGDSRVAAQTEEVSGGIGVDLPAVAFIVDEALLERRAELDDAVVLGLELIDFEVNWYCLGCSSPGGVGGLWFSSRRTPIRVADSYLPESLLA